MESVTAAPITDVGIHRYVVMAGWGDVPHLTPTVQAELLKSIPPHQRQARSKGVPQLGAGVIYPVAEEDIRVKDFQIPRHFSRGYAVDTGWNWFGAVFGAHDREADVLYLTSIYKRGEAPPSIHADVIKQRANGYMKGVGDAAAISIEDGEQVITKYKRLGLDLELADKAVEAGIADVWERLISDRLKVFASCSAWFEEYRLYRRDKKGKIVKENDHLMDPTRYLVRSGLRRFTTPPIEPDKKTVWTTSTGRQHGWMR